MALRAKQPEIQKSRLKAVVYGNMGTGKTHLCCSFPNVYYIDTEGVEKYEKFVKMIKNNNGMVIHLPEIEEIIKEVKELLKSGHNYKTLVIDSLSFPYAILSSMEAERLSKKSKSGDIEGTEFGANVAKPKRLTYQLGILLARLDMNVIVTAHEATKYENNQEIGKKFDISDKIGYALGSVWHLKASGKNVKMFVEKTRYEELPRADLLDFNDGYGKLKELFGEEIFLREAVAEELTTPELIKEFERLVGVFNVPLETVQKWYIKEEVSEPGDMNVKTIQKYIDFLNSKLKGEAA